MTYTVEYMGVDLSLGEEYVFVVEQKGEEYKAKGTLETWFEQGCALVNIDEATYPNGNWDNKGFYVRKEDNLFLQEPTQDETNRYNKVGVVQDVSEYNGGSL